MTAARCLVCGIVLAPFGGRDIGAIVLEHVRSHRGADIVRDLPDSVRNHPSTGGAA